MRRLQSRFRDAQRISRGKFDRLPLATAGFTTSALDGYDLRCHWPARPAPYASDPVHVHRFLRLLHASSGPHLPMTSFRFAIASPPSGSEGDFHLELLNMLGTPKRKGRIAPALSLVSRQEENGYTRSLRRRVSRPTRTPPSSVSVIPPSGTPTCGVAEKPIILPGLKLEPVSPPTRADS